MWENSACQVREMYTISLSRAYKNIWEQDNVCPDLPNILGSSSQIHIPFLGTSAHRAVHQQMCENARLRELPRGLPSEEVPLLLFGPKAGMIFPSEVDLHLSRCLDRKIQLTGVLFGSQPRVAPSEGQTDFGRPLMFHSRPQIISKTPGHVSYSRNHFQQSNLSISSTSLEESRGSFQW